MFNYSRFINILLSHRCTSTVPTQILRSIHLIISHQNTLQCQRNTDKLHHRRRITLSGGSTTNALIRARDASTLRPRRGSTSSRWCTAVRSSASTILLSVDFIPLSGTRGRHRLQHLFHAGETRCTDRGRSGLPAQRNLRHPCFSSFADSSTATLFSDNFRFFNRKRRQPYSRGTITSKLPRISVILLVCSP